MVRVIVLAVTALLCIGAATPRSDLAPPPGILPTHATLASVLARNHAATPSVQSALEKWTISYGEMHGERTEAWTQGATRTDETLGPYHTAYGEGGGREWVMNENGEVALSSGLHQRDEIDAEVMAHATAASSSLQLLGTVSDPVHAYVVRLSPPNGRVRYLFYDMQTFRVVRVETAREGRRVATTYDRFTTISGKSVASHLHIEDGKPANTRDETLEKATFGSVPANALAIPTPGPPIVALASKQATLPAKIIDDRIILPFKIGAHTVDLQLDSGAAQIVLDSGVIEKLGIKQYGRVTSSTAGDYTSSDATIASMTLGDLTITNAHVVSAPFFNFADEKTPVAGLMGYDFLDEVVLHVDYQHGTIEAINPSSFTPPAGAQAMPITLDDLIPAVHGSLAGLRSLVFGIDTGADRSLLFKPFADEHRAQIPDRGLGEAMEASSPFLDSFAGVGGQVEYRPLEAGPLQLGSWNFDKWLFYVTQDAPSFDIEDYAGLIGQDVLRNYDLYLDYPHLKIYLKPNDRYHDRWGE